MWMEGGPCAASHRHQHAQSQQYGKRVTQTVLFNTNDMPWDGELLSPMHTWETEAQMGGDPQSHWQMAEPCCLPNGGGLTYWGTPTFPSLPFLPLSTLHPQLTAQL